MVITYQQAQPNISEQPEQPIQRLTGKIDIRSIRGKAMDALVRPEMERLRKEDLRNILREFIRNFPLTDIGVEGVSTRIIDMVEPYAFSFLREHFAGRFSFDDYTEVMKELGYPHDAVAHLRPVRSAVRELIRRWNTEQRDIVEFSSGVDYWTVIDEACRRVMNFQKADERIRRDFHLNCNYEDALLALEAEGIIFYRRDGENLYEVIDKTAGVIYEFDPKKHHALSGVRRIGESRKQD